MEKATFRPRGTDSAKVIQIIETKTLRGSGQKDDLYRTVTQYWDFEGRLLAEDDVCAKDRPRKYGYQLSKEEVMKLLDWEFPTSDSAVLVQSQTLEGLIKNLLREGNTGWFSGKDGTVALITALLYGRAALEANSDISAHLQEKIKEFRDFCERYYNPQ
ncbi:MAG: hypothetical protein ACOX8K_10195 [Lachnospiraceae bacterium]|jgi:hypothetical protein